ncbi:hypothetical protein SEVIR_9G080800v4 [Setaria viridis]|uniref:Uncharacterized protein n=2 Tax=Setaria TaxID=4554 RepID=A0A368SEA0_SETIT|nr:hypothetical protein SETIT_9G082300v2 [Setaria italica]TKV91226.1 hypothetical protein SEVIR_9G080800v2 [Setaria viridis]
MKMLKLFFFEKEEDRFTNHLPVNRVSLHGSNFMLLRKLTREIFYKIISSRALSRLRHENIVEPYLALSEAQKSKRYSVLKGFAFISIKPIGIVPTFTKCF